MALQRVLVPRRRASKQRTGHADFYASLLPAMIPVALLGSAVASILPKVGSPTKNSSTRRKSASVLSKKKSIPSREIPRLYRSPPSRLLHPPKRALGGRGRDHPLL
ncbi:hypothetical protein J3R82DRAFT_3986 [Butyriboletus roseoflavus]|nr:hypothetical protein J3R82DRAFT_3986 [Butyriboletus roseoflavus]